jgi:hypothetical protein
VLTSIKPVDLRVYPDKIIVVSNGEIIADHERSFERHKKILNPYHYLSILERKPGALRNGLPFKDWVLPESLLKVKEHLMSKDGGDKEVVNILVTLKEYSIESVDVACDIALKDGVINSQYICNCLTRLNCEESSEVIEVESHLDIKEPPAADCNKYNKLLEGVVDGDC